MFTTASPMRRTDSPSRLSRSGGLFWRPTDPDVDTEEELLASSYKVAARGEASILEPKEKVKAKLGGRRPDRSDALALAVSAWQGKVQPRGLLVLHWW